MSARQLFLPIYFRDNIFSVGREVLLSLVLFSSFVQELPNVRKIMDLSALGRHAKDLQTAVLCFSFP